MLQEATRALNSAFNNSFIKKLSQYLHDCVREEVKSATFRNLKQDKDNKWIFLHEEEKLFHNFGEYLKLDGSDSKLTELMIQSELSQKDKYLIYGYLFLVGKSSKNKKSNEFLTPLLYMPCRLERNGVNINCMLQDEFLSLNTGALTALMKKSDDEDEVEQLLEGLLDVVPDLPITKEKLDIFLTTLKSIIPEIEIKIDHSEDVDEDNITKDFYKEIPEDEVIDSENIDEVVESVSIKTPVKIDKITLTNQCSIILTKRPSVTAGVLHELIQIAEKPSGVYRETALNIINEEYLQTKGKLVDNPVKQSRDLKDFAAVTPLSLSDSQENVIKSLENNTFVAVYGPPGTGKSQTIVNLVSHLIANGKTVLVASRMDKAVDVVSERLNDLGAPFLALRAGRMNYQKQLSFQLQDLLSNKVDLDSEYEDTLFAEVKDMKELLNNIKELENKSENIIQLEHRWQELFMQKAEQEKILGQMSFIKESLKKAEIDQIKNIIEVIEKNLEKTGFFASISNYSSKNKLKKLLKLTDFNESYENIGRLKQELDIAKLACEMLIVESNIQKLGNLHVNSEQIRMLKKKQRHLAIDILKGKRRESLKGLLRDQTKRQRLIVHTKSLVERKKNLQNRLLEGEDFKPLMEAFPCWCVTTYAISGSLPMKPGLFDVAIIDEASQCDIASCFPILFRAKKAVVVGDDKQLPHLSFLEKAKEQSFLSQYSIPDKYQLMWRFRTNSMFDLANYYSMNPVLLDEHFRSLPPIINFSNQEFYGDRMRIMRRNSNENSVLELVHVNDGKVDFDATRNLPEVEAVVSKLQELIIEDERKNPDNPVSIGIISPFRAQVEQLKISVARVLSEHMIKKHRIEIGTAHTFQGDEKDIILISWAFAANSFSQSLTFLQKPNLFNVAITRARYRMINFISKDPKELPDGVLRSYLSYVQEYQARKHAILNNEIDENIYKNSFEKDVAATIRDLGYKVQAGVEVAGFSVDILVDGNIAIECDGVQDQKRASATNMKKQAILERSGYKINRVTFREWQYSPKACLDRILLN